MQTKSIQKFVSFSPELYALIASKAGKFGLSVPEYLRILAVNDVKEEVKELEMVDEETEKRIGEALKDYKKGRYTTVRTKEELKKYLDKLDSEI